MTNYAKSQDFSNWTSTNSSIFTPNTNGTATYDQLSGTQTATITSPKFFYVQGTSDSISFTVSGFTNQGYNSCGLKPQMSIKLLDDNGAFISNIDTFELSNSTRSFSASVPSTGDYKISLTITTENCNNKSLPTITLGNLQVPLTLLPVNFISFTSKKLQNNVILEWQTSDEHDCSHYEVEKYNNLLNEWSTIGNVSSNNMHSVNLYSFIDENTTNGLNAYRIKQFDINQKYSYSNSSFVLIENKVEFNVFPNPTYDVININLEYFKNIKIYNSTGVMVIESNSNTIDIKHLQFGYYFCVIEDLDNKIHRISIRKN
jgi:hypothetical protein